MKESLCCSVVRWQSPGKHPPNGSAWVWAHTCRRRQLIPTSRCCCSWQRSWTCTAAWHNSAKPCTTPGLPWCPSACCPPLYRLALIRSVLQQVLNFFFLFMFSFTETMFKYNIHNIVILQMKVQWFNIKLTTWSYKTTYYMKELWLWVLS